MRIRDQTLRAQALGFVAIALVASLLALAAFHYQLHSLVVGGRDLGFFMATYERLLEATPWRELAVQPNGNNAFGFSGTDGFPTLHHDIHFSPLKYALASVYAATRSWLAVELVLALAHVAALAYVLARWHRVAPRNLLTLGVIAALALSAPFVRTLCHDLRPSVALGAFAVALVAAMLSRAPTSHLGILAVLGLLVREDAAVLLALASVWIELDGRKADARRLFTLAIGYVVLFHVAYFGALPFDYAPRLDTVLVWAALLAYPALTLAPRRVIEALRDAHLAHRAWTILVLAAPFAYVLLAPFVGGHLVRGAAARAFPALLVTCVAAAYWVLTRGGARVERAATVLAFSAILPALSSSVRMIDDLRERADRSTPVWALAESLPDETPIVTDFAHYQAFAGRDRLLVWERLPAAIEPTEARELPASRRQLVALLVDHEGLLIVSDASYEELTETLRVAGVEPALERCASDSSFVVARRASSGVECPRLSPFAALRM